MKSINQTSKYFYIIGAALTAVLGVVGHFLYEWSGKIQIIGYFCAVNESTWEHLKLLFFPFLLWTIFAYCYYGRKQDCFLGASACGCLAGLMTIVVTFYTYRGVLGFNVDFINIAIYFLGVVVCFYLMRQSITQGRCYFDNTDGIIFFIIMTAMFLIFTLFPPRIGLFISPI